VSSQVEQPKKDNWPKDEFGRSEVFGQLWLWVVGGVAIITAIVVSIFSGLHRGETKQVVVYCAQDQMYAQPVFAAFEKETGIKVRAVYDNEAIKTVGLANRLLAERAHPQCDVFWGNEEMRARQLSGHNVFREKNGFVTFGYRSRRMVINTNQLTLQSVPRSLLELTNENWRNKVALAYPQFGTTSAHFHALRQIWGNEVWERWCRGVANNKALVVDGNSLVVRIVGKGEAWVGLTDSDDIAAGIREGLPIAACPMNEETLLIPNTVAVTRNAPHPEAAESLFKHLQEPGVTARLIAVKALEGSSMNEVSIRYLKVDWGQALNDIEGVTEKLNQIFLR